MTDAELDAIDDLIEAVVDKAPPLTAEQRDKLATLLAPVRIGFDAVVLAA